MIQDSLNVLYQHGNPDFIYNFIINVFPNSQYFFIIIIGPTDEGWKVFFLIFSLPSPILEKKYYYYFNPFWWIFYLPKILKSKLLNLNGLIDMTT